MWEAIEDRHRSPCKTLDVFIPRSIDDGFESIGPMPSLNTSQLSEPRGMSGGGYWQKIDTSTADVWLPDDYGLIAVQSRWWGLGRYLQATQIIHWLRLVWAKRPDLHDALKSQFDESDLAS